MLVLTALLQLTLLQPVDGTRFSTLQDGEPFNPLRNFIVTPLPPEDASCRVTVPLTVTASLKVITVSKLLNCVSVCPVELSLLVVKEPFTVALSQNGRETESHCNCRIRAVSPDIAVSGRYGF